MNVCFIVPDAYAAAANLHGAHIGGAETQQFHFAEALRSAGYNVTFIVAKPDMYSDIDDSQTLPAWVKVAYSLRNYSSKFGFFKDSINLFLSMKTAKANIYIQRCSFHDAPRVWLFSKLLKSKFIFWIGSDFNIDLEYQASALSRLRRMTYKYSIKRASAIICQTVKQQNMLLANFGLRSFLVRNMVGIPTKQTKFSSTTNRLTAIWGGRINKNKRPDLLISLAQQTTNWEFIFVAIKDRCREEQYDTFVAKVSELSNAKVIPSLSHNEYLKLTSQADLVLNTSLVEGFPNTLLEAFAQSVPALTIGIDPDNALSNNHIGWVCNDTIEASGKMQLFHDNRDLLTHAGIKALSYVMKYHSEKNTIDSLKSVLRKTLHAQ